MSEFYDNCSFEPVGISLHMKRPAVSKMRGRSELTSKGSCAAKENSSLSLSLFVKKIRTPL